jgi:hypothetical protein
MADSTVFSFLCFASETSPFEKGGKGDLSSTSPASVGLLNELPILTLTQRNPKNHLFPLRRRAACLDYPGRPTFAIFVFLAVALRFFVKLVEKTFAA